MKILITGAGGFVGKHLVKHLRRDLLTPTRNDLDLTNANSVKNYLDLHQPNCIIHLAANANGKPDDNNTEQIINDNILTTQLLCQFAPQGCRFIFASSIVTYGNTPEPAVETSPCNPTSIYGATKLASEAIISAYTQQRAINGISLRFCAIVGSGLTHGMFYDFVRKLRSSSKELEVFGNCPGAAKPFLHTYDAIQTIKFMVDNPYYISTVNVAPLGVLSVNQAAKMTMDILDIHKPIKWNGNAVWKGDNILLQADSHKLYNVGCFIYYATSRIAVVNAIRDINADNNNME